MECGPTLHARGSDRVVGAGDVVRAPQALLGGESARVEHWASTLAHADLAAANLLAGPGEARPLTSLPTFGTTIHGARIRAVGFPQVADRSRGGLGLAWRPEVRWWRWGAGSQLVALVSLDAHERLASLVSQLRPGTSLDDLRTVSDVSQVWSALFQAARASRRRPFRPTTIVEPSWPATPSGSGRIHTMSHIDQHGDHRRREGQVGLHHPVGPPGHADHLGSVASSSRTITASAVSSARSEPCRPMRHAELGRGHGGGVVDAVADEQHPAPPA